MGGRTTARRYGTAQVRQMMRSDLARRDHRDDCRGRCVYGVCLRLLHRGQDCGGLRSRRGDARDFTEPSGRVLRDRRPDARGRSVAAHAGSRRRIDRRRGQRQRARFRCVRFVVGGVQSTTRTFRQHGTFAEPEARDPWTIGRNLARHGPTGRTEASWQTLAAFTMSAVPKGWRRSFALKVRFALIPKFQLQDPARKYSHRHRALFRSG